eukprot:TRINITY_DN5002_c0_g1_i3.p1 TRINITY_DN5002_c0_g1~~TRINITY_DN5002_c0_g1_i3.p1  ORF type:complete len:516 (+),score=133.63 TRINITY_DN5002_c0_g1_i3:185-1732(+)
MSDIYGRRPILLLGAVGSLLSAVCFGFSSSLSAAICFRAINGLLNGNIGVVKTYIGEVTDSTNQIKAFSVVGMIWGLGNICGPMLGGFLSMPADKWPHLAPRGSLLDHYPFLLPNLFSTIVTLVGLVVGYFKITESRKFKHIDAMLITTKASKTLNSDGQEITDDGDLELEMMVPPEEKSPSYDEDTETETDAANINIALEDTKFVHVDKPPSLMDRILSRVLFWRSRKPSNVYQGLQETNIIDEPVVKTKSKSIFKDPLILVTTCQYALLGLTFSMLDEGFPLWAMATTERGGLSFESNEIGITGAINGVTILFVQMLIYPLIGRRLGLVRTFSLGVMLSIPLFLSFPSLSYVLGLGGTPLMWVAMGFVLLLRAFSAQCAFTSVFNLINNSAPPSRRGAANGFGQSLVALTRAFAPSLAANLLAWGLSTGATKYGFPFNAYLPFVVMSFLSIIIIVVSLKYMPFSLNLPVPEDETIEEVVLVKHTEQGGKDMSTEEHFVPQKELHSVVNVDGGG